MSASVLLIDPKFAHNIGGAVRAMSCFGEGTVLYHGDRVNLGNRLPREERMKAYSDVKWAKSETTRPIDELEGTPVAIELLPSSMPLHQFEHPEDAIYVFGPEDGSLPRGIRTACHQFVTIPSKHCLNLAAAVYITLFHRTIQRFERGLDPMPTLDEDRGYWFHSPALEDETAWLNGSAR